jgi:hypothetical protein
MKKIKYSVILSQKEMIYRLTYTILETKVKLPNLHKVRDQGEGYLTFTRLETKEKAKAT